MSLTLAEIRAKLQAQEDKKGGASSGSFGDGTIFPHWSIEEGQTTSLRFLPDADPKNSFFWVEKAMIKLPFAGIKGQSDSKPVIVQVPCMEMWGESCPILAEVRPWFKDKSLEEMGRKYWKKRSYLMQGFVRENPLNEEKVPENPIRRFVLSPSVFGLVKAALMDPELENLPTDYAAGLDFRITKTSKGGFADYGTSKWARKESSLSAEEAEAIEKYGLFNLTEFLPKKPTDVELQVMKEMFEASVDGQAYDADKWGQYFKPFGLKEASGDAGDAMDSTPAAPAPKAAAPAPKAAESVANDPPFEPDPPKAAASAPAASGASRAEDILAMIRSRQK
jgi:hypothetical protein